MLGQTGTNSLVSGGKFINSSECGCSIRSTFRPPSLKTTLVYKKTRTKGLLPGLLRGRKFGIHVLNQGSCFNHLRREQESRIRKATSPFTNGWRQAM